MIDRYLFWAVVALFVLSLVMSYSLSAYTVRYFGYNDFHFFIRQSVAVSMGLFIIITLSRLDPDRWFVPLGMLLFIVSFVLMVVMQFLPASLVTEVGGAKRWIKLPGVSISPVEFFKVGFVFFLAWSFSRKFSKHRADGFFNEFRSYAPYLIIFAIAAVVIAVFQKDLGQVVVLSAVLLALFILIGGSWKFFLAMTVTGLASFVALIVIAPHRLARIKSWWIGVQDTILSILPFLDRFRIEGVSRESWQISNSLNAIHQGGFFGKGLGNGQFKLGYVSEVHTDFILAGIAEEFGFLGIVLVTLLIVAIIFRLLKNASRVQKDMHYLFGAGIAVMIGVAFLLNAYGVSGITPIKGIAVPFLSYGGSHIFALSIAIGMVLMISKKAKR